MEQEKLFSGTGVARMMEEVLGCKWSLAVLDSVRRGVCRPGAIERAIGGISTKVLNERLRKLVRYGVLEKLSYPEIPPRVEYRLTGFGQRFVSILEQIEALERARGRS
ncbi:winged helix-turn-helix transcriptional regulator [Thiobacter aerophilum]|uniref:Helix-turn-helix domain-containing protein n=1 Tax=Thiobacter aerophilum TaxID=3121275 RepID=A0ABV0EF33_9BURK